MQNIVTKANIVMGEKLFYAITDFDGTFLLTGTVTEVNDDDFIVTIDDIGYLFSFEASNPVFRDRDEAMKYINTHKQTKYVCFE